MTGGDRAAQPRRQDGRVDVSGVVVVRGAGDIATGVLQKLVHAGFDVVALEAPRPSAIRWRAAASTAVTRGRWWVEDIEAVAVPDADAALAALVAPPTTTSYVVPVLADPDASLLATLRPVAVVDAILAKRNLGTHRGMAPVTVACGPGFTAGVDVDYVVETMRGHELGRVITDGAAQPNTGVPGLIAGRAAERVLHAPAAGVVRVRRGIGDIVAAGEILCTIEADDDRTHDVPAPFAGVVRGMIPDGYRAGAGLKIADVDPRSDLRDCCDTISDKSRAVGGGALDAVLQGLRRARSTS